ncbi:hypothetical protein [Natronoglycomyces albus]|uniref:SH3 domain-containing protein n=1 Tax=Natronoglycomyces albus TaxID=2811108 RepID=A0A895XUU7_9ACTN|nr:hypothetical protein [Natronoglycomyces albus]QSB06000.1 hypothetical protein JQS30_03490 [Natronoglycomyces albus]
MRKTTSKLIAMAAAGALSFGLLATTAGAASASGTTTSQNISTQTDVAPERNVICRYQVRANGGLFQRDAPNGNIVGSLANGSVVLAYQNRVQRAGGISWRQLSNGNWAGASYLHYTGDPCMV